MDNSRNIIDNFKQLLIAKRCSDKSVLYQEINENKLQYKPQDVINSVYSQMRAIQAAENPKSVKNVRNKTMDNKSCFLPVSQLPTYREVPQNQNNFETEFVSDTQLINIIENAEALDTQTGIVQEFNTTFTYETVDKEREIDINVSKHIADAFTPIDNEREAKSNDDVAVIANISKHIADAFTPIDKEREGKSNDDVAVIANISKHIADAFTPIDNEREGKSNDDVASVIGISSNINEINKDVGDERNDENLIVTIDTKMEQMEPISKDNESYVDRKESIIENSDNDDESSIIENDNSDERPASPIFNTKMKKLSSLTVPLESFENFEKIVLPIIEKCSNKETTKHVINSQIIGKELFLHGDCFEINERISPEIPVEEQLHVSKIEILSHEKLKNEKKISQYVDEKNDHDSFGVKNAIDIDVTDSNNLDKDFLEQTDRQDDILFSSDEELEYVQKEMVENDLPLTCVLETSFYDEPDVLEKTMYVGFTTASDKSIQINTESFDKAKSMLESKELSISELVSLSEKGKMDFNNSKVESNLVCVKKSDKDTRITKDESNIQMNINLKDRTLESKIQNTSFDNVVNTLIQSENIEKVTNVTPAMIPEYQLNNNIDKVDITMTNDTEIKASNEYKTVNDSEAKLDSNTQDLEVKVNKTDVVALNEYENVNNGDLKMDFNTQALEVKVTKTDTELDFDKINDDLLLEELSNIEMSLKEEFVGFKTASNKDIKISNEGKSKSQNIFKDLIEMGPVNDNLSYKKNLIENSLTFKTASNKKIDISDATLAKSKNIFQDFHEDDLSEENIIKNDTAKNVFQGFRTGNNKAIDLPKSALIKAKNIFKDIDKEIAIKSSKEFGNQGDERLLKDDTLCTERKSGLETVKDNIDKEIAIKDKSTKDFGNKGDERLLKDDTLCTERKSGLETVKDNIDKEIAIKDKSTKDFGNKVDESLLLCTEIGFKTVKDINSDKEIAIKSSKDFGNKVDERLLKDEGLCTGFSGFKTASNREVVISKESLNKSKKVFENLDTVLQKNIPYNKRNKDDYPIEINDTQNLKAHEKVTVVNSIENESYNVRNKVDYPMFKGFQTASNKQVTITKESLEKSRKLFENINASENELISDRNKVDYPMFKGFQTASNKQVTITKESLEKSRKLFENINASENELNSDRNKVDYPMFKGFQTASNKQVTITKDSLEKSRKLFENIDDFDTKNKMEFENESYSKENKVKNSIFIGFQTANNKQVDVSNDALIRSKKIFENINEFETKTSLDANNKKVSIHKESLKKEMNIASANMKKVFKGRSADILFRGLQNANAGNARKNAGNQENAGYAIEIAGSISAGNVRENAGNIQQNAGKTIENVDNARKNAGNTKHDFESHNAPENKNIPELYLDTQLQNNFEENFDVIDNKRKRSDSPILSCPKAKKRRFETPYKITKQTPIQPKISTPKKPILKFTENYKKHKILNIKVLKFNQNEQIDEYLTRFNFDNILNFEFNGRRNEITHNKITVPELIQAFKESVNEKIIPDNWLNIQIKLILWKLISYEAKFSIFVCTIQNTIDQLKYRYDKELYNAERPILRKIYEKDDLSTRTMVLCVARIFENGVSVTSASSINNIELQLTDGWYFIMATLDKMLSKLVYDKKIVVGCKIVTTGAELLNCEQGMSPWEDTSLVRLKLSGNSTRLARTYTKLGCNRDRMMSTLSSANINGGSLPLLRVCVGIVYPMLYLDKLEDGNTVTRSERLEHLYQMEYEMKREATFEKIYEDLMREFEQESQDSENTPDYGTKRKCFDSGSQIAKMMKRSRDPMEFKAQLTSSQLNLLQEHTNRHTDRFLGRLQEKVRETLNNRKVVTLLRVRVIGVDKRGVKTAMLSVWKPNDAILELIKEGSWIEIMNVVPTAIRNSELQLSAGRQSYFRSANVQKEKFAPEITSQIDKYKRKCYHIEELTQVISNKSAIEIDTVGIVFQIEPENTIFDPKKDNFQNVFLADADKNIISVNFWGGIKKFGFQNIIEIGQVISLANLQRRAGNTRKSVPQFRVTELTCITKTPKFLKSRQIIEELQKNILNLNIKKFCEDCVAIKNNYTALRCFSVEKESPIFNKSDFNLSKNKKFLAAPVRPLQDDLNLTGLDFESTFKQTESQDLSPNTLLRKKKVKEKIDKLKMYGEPPPLSPINIINKSKISGYKSPIISKNELSDTNMKKLPEICVDSVTSVENIPEDCAKKLNLPENRDSVANVDLPENNDKISSPIISMNKTYVKRSTMNPIKLNFSNVVSNQDEFADDFDGSPPLSLE